MPLLIKKEFQLFDIVPNSPSAGFELGTFRLWGKCATDWAIKPTDIQLQFDGPYIVNILGKQWVNLIPKCGKYEIYTILNYNYLRNLSVTLYKESQQYYPVRQLKFNP